MPNIDGMSDEKFAELMNTPKHCSKCNRTLKTESFDITTARGNLLIRSWCCDCMKAYYREYARRKRSKV